MVSPSDLAKVETVLGYTSDEIFSSGITRMVA